MTIADMVAAICGGLVSGITSLGTGIATGVKSFVTALVFDTSGSDTTLSVFVNLVVTFGAIALGVGITTLIFNWIRNLGA